MARTWVIGVNLRRVIHGIRGLVPIELAQDEPGYMVNTASITGQGKGHHGAPCATTKHAVVALREQLTVEFERVGAKLRAAVLYPSWVDRRINESGRNRPVALRNPDPAQLPTPEMLHRR